MNKSDKNQPQIDHFKCENLNYDLDTKESEKFVLKKYYQIQLHNRDIYNCVNLSVIITVIKQKMLKFYENFARLYCKNKAFDKNWLNLSEPKNWNWTETIFYFIKILESVFTIV